MLLFLRNDGSVGEGQGLLANAFLTVAKRRLLKVAMTRVLFD